MNRASLRNAVVGWLLGGLGLWAADLGVRADVVVLRGGGQIQGKVVADPASKGDRVEVLLLKSKAPLSLRKEQISEVIPRSSPLDEYVVKRGKVAPTAEAEFDLGEWCERNGLGELAQVHYEAALKHDDAFVAAHQKLGHVEHNGRWLSRDDFRKVQGLIQYKGRWITEDEKAREDEEAQSTAEQASWIRKIRLMVQGLGSDAPDRRREAENQLMAIRDPEAVAPLMKVLGAGDADMRVLLAQILGEIPGAESARALVSMILAEEQDQVRIAVLDQLKRDEEPGVLPQLVRALRSKNGRVINRAAWTLGNLDAVSAVPRLLGVLVTSEERVVLEPPGGWGGSPQIPAPRPILMAYNGSSAAYMTPPVVAPGAVAFGAYVVPGVFGLNPFNGGAPLTAYGYPTGEYPGYSPPVGADRGPAPRLVTFTYQNVEVHDALTKLTEQDFGYDVKQWRDWIARSFNPRPEPVRRIPQP